MRADQLEPSAHIFPSDLEKFKESETFAHAFSVEVGNPDERSVPLFTLEGSLGDCVKACEGIPDDILQSWLNPPEGQLGAPHGTWAQQLAAAGKKLIQIQQERDELFSALKEVLAAHRAFPKRPIEDVQKIDCMIERQRKACVVADELISKLETQS